MHFSTGGIFWAGKGLVQLLVWKWAQREEKKGAESGACTGAQEREPKG